MNSETSLQRLLLSQLLEIWALFHQSQDSLEGLRELTNENGSLLIFDEVMTGFRVGYNCAQGHY